MGGIDYAWVKDAIEQYGDVLNNAYNMIINILCNSTYLSTILADEKVAPLLDAIKGTAIILCAIFFLLDFFSKSLHFQWVSWENVLMLFLKLTVAKVCVDNAEWITTMLYNGFCSLGSSITESDLTHSFLPEPPELYSYFLTNTEVQKLDTQSFFLNLDSLMMATKVNIIGWTILIVLLVSNVVIIGRMFELAVYTLVAPIPLSTLACDGLQDVGKNFLKSYAAVCIQAIVLIIMFLAYNAVSELLIPVFNILDGFKAIIMCLVLGLSVMQSGQWAKRICGAM